MSHREAVGGLWDEIGELQLRFLVSQGLEPGHRLLDVGCGSFRAGVRLLRYLEAGNYYGLDANAELIDAGLEHEVAPAGLTERMPRSNLLVTSEFEASRFGVLFDVALAQSVFTHLTANQIRRCLIELPRALKPGAVLYATFFECPDGHPEEQPLRHEPGGITTFMDHDPFHYREEDLRRLADGLPWEVTKLGPWEHPRDQRMLRLVRAG
ncbi:MAG: class I SAM-dependent methyltransferase [Holophagales bacterium]|nr:class I SAM-dependent methyltransferase [Holophagales bacterium]MBK9966006.1 class I SAM-dependent methyltransferase [Holophagales bacterium]